MNISPPTTRKAYVRPMVFTAEEDRLHPEGKLNPGSPELTTSKAPS